jgi:hypothetical protein
LNVHGVDDVRQTEMHTAEPLISEPSCCAFEIAIGKLKWYKSAGINQIREIWFKQDVIHLVLRFTNPLILFGIMNNCKTSLVIAEEYHCYQLHTVLSNILVSRLTQYVDEIIEDHQCGFRRSRSTTDQIFCLRQMLKKRMTVYCSTLVLYRFREGVWFCEEGNVLQFSHWNWYTCETS